MGGNELECVQKGSRFAFTGPDSFENHKTDIFGPKETRDRRRRAFRPGSTFPRQKVTTGFRVGVMDDGHGERTVPFQFLISCLGATGNTRFSKKGRRERRARSNLF